MRICTHCARTFEDDVEKCPDDGTELMSPSDAMVGQKVGRYVLVKRLGKGGMGSVYLGLHPTIKSRVAIKILNTSVEEDPEQYSRFVVEAQAVNQIQHKNIVKIIDLDVLPDGHPYVVMEYLEGATLFQRMRGSPPLKPEEAKSIIVQVLDAVGAAHQAGFVHRDLKPENIFVANDGTAKLLDFGITKLLAGPDKTGLTRTGDVVGTPMYLSPEQAKGDVSEISPQSDLYALGVILYEMYTGRPPFDAGNVYRILLCHADEDPIPPRERSELVTPKLEEVILWCLQKDQSQRPSSATVLLDAFLNAHDEYGAALGGLDAEATLPVSVKTPVRARIPKATDPKTPPAETRTTHPSGTFVLVQTKKNETLDPVEAIRTEDCNLLYHTHEPLVRVNRLTGTVEPCLALSWEMSENEYKFKLRSDVEFHDGTIMDAASVASSFRRAEESPLGKAFLWDLDEAEAIGPYEVALRVSKQSGSFLARISVWKAYITKSTADYPVGTGPFRIRSWNPAIGSVVLEANTRYWGPIPMLKNVVVRSVQDEAVRVGMLLQGEAHLSTDISSDSALRLSEAGGFRVMRAVGGFCGCLFFNTRRECFADSRVRRAVAEAMDVRSVVRNIYGNEATAAVSILPPCVRITPSDVRPYRYDPKRATEVLRGSALMSKQLKLFLYSEKSTSIPSPEEVAKVLVEALGAAGLNVTPVFLPYAECIKACSEGQHDFAYFALGPDYPDPESMFLYFSQEGTEAGYNISLFQDDQYERMLYEARVELDLKKRISLLASLEGYLLENCPAIPIAFLGEYVALSAKAKDVSINVEYQDPLYSLTRAHLL